MRLSVVAMLLVATVSGSAFGHSLSPPTINVRAINDMTRVRLTAINHFEQSATYEVLVYEDADGQKPLTEARAVPAKFTLGPYDKRTFTVLTPTPTDVLYVCTRRVPSARSKHIRPTEVCSAVSVKRRITRP